MHAAGKNQRYDVPLKDKLSLSPEEASALSGIGLTSIREAVKDAKLAARKHGKRTIILPEDLKTWLARLPQAGRKTVGDETVEKTN